MMPPDNLNHVPRTVFDDRIRTPPDQRHFCDQIALITGTSGAAPAPSLRHRNAGTFDLASGVVSADDTNQLSSRMSDHFPALGEFDLNSTPASVIASRGVDEPS